MNRSKLKPGPFGARTAKKKITLSSANNFSLDQIIQFVARHMILQNARSYDNDCMYRSEKGLTCAVGCIISDSEYDTEMETFGIHNQRFDKFGIETGRRALLGALQILHDSTMPYQWHNELMSLCNQCGLDTAALKAVIDAAISERQAGEVK